MAESDTQTEEMELESMLNEYNEVCSEEDTVDNLHKKAELAYYISNEVDDADRKKWLKTGREHALNALKLAPESVKVLKFVCATTGSLAEESGMVDKVRLAFEFKHYLDLAIRLDNGSDEDTTYDIRHMRGFFIHAVETLTTIEKTIAKGLGVIPKVTIKQAIQDLLKANEVCPDTVENELLLAKCYQVDGEMSNAVKWLEKAASGDDEDSSIVAEYINEAKKLLAEITRREKTPPSFLEYFCICLGFPHNGK